MLNPTFCRRVLLVLTIEALDRPSVPKLMKNLGWPRRTVQDVLKALAGMGVEVRFIEDGIRHNDGYYHIENWGAVDRSWALHNQHRLREALMEVS